jgi:hypothetical protein
MKIGSTVHADQDSSSLTGKVVAGPAGKVAVRWRVRVDGVTAFVTYLYDQRHFSNDIIMEPWKGKPFERTGGFVPRFERRSRTVSKVIRRLADDQQVDS